MGFTIGDAGSCFILFVVGFLDLFWMKISVSIFKETDNIHIFYCFLYFVARIQNRESGKNEIMNKRYMPFKPSH
jgi:hypothetical protein